MPSLVHKQMRRKKYVRVFIGFFINLQALLNLPIYRSQWRRPSVTSICIPQNLKGVPNFLFLKI